MIGVLRRGPVIRAGMTALSLALFLWGAIPVVAHPLQVIDAGNYQRSILDASKECPGDPVPTPGGCWSKAPAKVMITGVDHLQSGDVQYAVVQVSGREPVRENLLDTDHVDTLSPGKTVVARFWGSSLSLLVVPTADRSRPVTMSTADNPVRRAAGFPIGGSVALVLGLAGLGFFGLPLRRDVLRWRRAVRIRREAEAAAREAAATPGRLRGLARYGIDHPALLEARLTGLRDAAGTEAAPPSRHAGDVAPSPAAVAPPEPQRPDVPSGLAPGGNGWNIRVR